MKKFKVPKAYLGLMLLFSVFAFLPGCGGNSDGQPAVITAFSLDGVSGTINEPAKSIAVNLPYDTDVTALQATYTTNAAEVTVDSTVQTSGESANDFGAPLTYTLIATDGSSSAYEVGVTLAPNTAKAMTAFSFADYAGTTAINETDKTIAVTVPYATDVTDLVATFATTGDSVMIGTAVQTSGAAPGNDFTSAVAYIVTAADGVSETYTVTVTEAANTAKVMSSYSFVGYDGAAVVITDNSITVTVPFATNVTNLTANFATTGDSVTVDGSIQTSGENAHNFTSTITYTVTAADDTFTEYIVTVELAPSTATAITDYSFADITGATGVITGTDIAVSVPFNTDLTSLKATFATSGEIVKVGATDQNSGSTMNDFDVAGNTLTYTVTAADGITTEYYNVTVTVDANTAKAITDYFFVDSNGDEIAAEMNINEAAKTIEVLLPVGTDRKALVAAYTTTGDYVYIYLPAADKFVPQESGLTENDFSASVSTPVIYTVSAADLTTVDYLVTVSLGDALGPIAVNLGTAGDFAILAESGVSATGVTHVTGDIGLSPLAASNITGFDQSADSSNTFSTSALVTGRIYAADYTPPTPTKMTTAVGDMHTAYTDAQTRVDPDFLNLYAGEIGGQTLVPGLYKYGTGLAISTDVTLTGGANDVWIIQVDQDLTVANDVIVTLSGGAQAKNIFWQVAGQANLGTTADFKGIILCKTQIAFNTGAMLNGRALAQTAVTLDATTITEPTP